IFPWYFLLQGVCGLLALATAWSWCWSPTAQAVDKIRFVFVAAALVTVLIGWPLAQRVSTLRSARYDPNPAVASAAKADFRTWHVYSLLLDLVTTGLVTVAMALTAQLPVASGPQAQTTMSKPTDRESPGQ